MVTSNLDFVFAFCASFSLAVAAGGLLRFLFPGLEMERYLAAGGVGLGILPVLIVFVWVNTYRKRQNAEIEQTNAVTYGQQLANWRMEVAGSAQERGVVVETAASHVLVSGGLLDEWERHHLEGCLLTLRHGSDLDSLTSVDLIGSAFVDYDHWNYWTDVLAVSRLADKTNGVATKVVRGYVWAKRQVMAGLFDSPVQYKDTPLPRLPLPFREGMYAKVKAEKVGKAAAKVAEAA